jgi:undecaprenyl-diphosphatase
MTLFQSFVLGAVQGVTEFLPVSSSAHLVLFPWVFGWKDPGLAFDAFLHLGTIVAVFFYFAGDWFRLIRAGFLSVVERKIGFETDRLLFWLLVLGSIPAGLAGLLLDDQAEAAFRNPQLIAGTLALVGFLLYWVDGRYPSTRKLEDLRAKDAFWIGMAQACAIVPGVSRSGSTMTMARFVGMSREASARYSFLLSLPITLAAGVFKGREVFQQTELGLPIPLLLTGLGASLVFGLLSIHVLIRFLRVADFGLFAWYRILLGAAILGWSVVSGT